MRLRFHDRAQSPLNPTLVVLLIPEVQNGALPQPTGPVSVPLTWLARLHRHEGNTMYAMRPDGVEVELHGDGTWTEVEVADFVDHPTDYSNARWVSEYDFGQRMITVTRAGGQGTGDWQLIEIVRDETLSDPDGRFEVFVVAKDGWRDRLVPGEIVKISAQLRNDGYLAAWRADFVEDPIVCDGMLWARYMHGGLRLGDAESHMFRHWTHASCGEILRTPTRVLPAWAYAHTQWEARRRRHPWNSARAMTPDGFKVQLHPDGTWTRIPIPETEHSSVSSDAEWVSEYDFDQRRVTLTRVPSPGTPAWLPNVIVRDQELSDPDGRFEVFVTPPNETILDRPHNMFPGEIVKVAARLDDDGYFAAWHPDFLDPSIVFQWTRGGLYQGGYSGAPEEMPTHWVYVSRGDIVPRWPRTWADAHGEWLDWRQRRRDT